MQRIVPPLLQREHPVAHFIHRFATPLTTGLFSISAISGVALFFHWSPSAFHSMHEWLSMVLLLPFALHVWKNWRRLIGYAKLGTLILPLVSSVVVAALFLLPNAGGERRGGNAGARSMALLTQAHIVDLAPILKVTPDKMLAALSERGFPAQSTDQTLDEVASIARKRGVDALSALLSP